MPKRIRTQTPKESKQERVTVYFSCTAGLRDELENVRKMANFESKNVAITQAIREFIAKYAPEYYREAQKVQATAEVYTTYLKENPQLGDMAQEARYRVLEKLRKEKEGTS